MKKHLSDLVSLRLLFTILASFIILMSVTAAFVYFYGKNNTNSLIRYSLENASQTAVIEAEQYGEDTVQSFAEYYDEKIAVAGNSFVKSTALAEEMKNDSVYNFHENNFHDIRSIVDPNGIVVVSTDPGMAGFDIGTDPYLSEFLCLTDGRTDTCSLGLITNPVNGKDIRYYGAFMPSYGGFYLQGDDIGVFKYNFNYFLEHFTEIDRIGTLGYYLLVNKDRKIISSPDRKYDDTSVTLSEDIEKLSENGKIVREDIYGISSYAGVLAAGDYYIVAVYPVSEAWEQWVVSMIILLLIYTIVFIILFFSTRRLIAANVVKGVYSLNDSLKLITGGDLDEKADFRDSIEFDELSDGINFTVDRLKGLIQEAHDRIDAELALAAKIQTSFLPHDFPAFPDRNEFELYAAMTPAKEVGGDFYDFFLVDKDHLALVMGDVSGKGIPAAMFMAAAKDKIRNSVEKYCTDVAEAIREVNLELIKENDAGLFVTVWLGVFTITTGHMEYVDAGHEYPAISRGGGEFRAEEDVHCVPVAARKKAKFEAGSFELAPGDILFLYTDGVTEANDPSGEMFRRERMLEALNRDRNAGVEEIDTTVRTAIADFVKDAPRFDDTTTLVFRYTCPEELFP